MFPFFIWNLFVPVLKIHNYFAKITEKWEEILHNYGEIGMKIEISS